MIGRDDLAGVDDFAAAPGNVAERGTRSQHSRADRFTSRMKEHQRNAQREAPDSPGAAYLKRHGWDGVDELRLVPDRIAALLLTEAEWTCALAARGVEVFGNWPGDLCPGQSVGRRAGLGPQLDQPARSRRNLLGRRRRHRPDDLHDVVARRARGVD